MLIVNCSSKAAALNQYSFSVWSLSMIAHIAIQVEPVYYCCTVMAKVLLYAIIELIFFKLKLLICSALKIVMFLCWCIGLVKYSLIISIIKKYNFFLFVFRWIAKIYTCYILNYVFVSSGYEFDSCTRYTLMTWYIHLS